MWLMALGSGALAAEVTLSAGVQDFVTQRPQVESVRFGGDLRLFPALAIGLQAGLGFGEPRPDALRELILDSSGDDLAYRSSPAQAAVLIDLGFGPPGTGLWAGGPHLVIGPAAHLRQERLTSGERLGPAQVAGGIAYGAAFDLWYGRTGARLSVVDHALSEDIAGFADTPRRVQSHVALGLDLRARL